MHLVDPRFALRETRGRQPTRVDLALAAQRLEEPPLEGHVDDDTVARWAGGRPRERKAKG